MTGKNRCRWLLFKKHITCNKICVNEFCGTHRFQLRNGCKVSPCRGCGVGIISVTGVCRNCGGHKCAQHLINVEHRARRNFIKVVSEINSIS